MKNKKEIIKALQKKKEEQYELNIQFLKERPDLLESYRDAYVKAHDKSPTNSNLAEYIITNDSIVYGDSENTAFEAGVLAGIELAIETTWEQLIKDTWQKINNYEVKE